MRSFYIGFSLITIIISCKQPEAALKDDGSIQTWGTIGDNSSPDDSSEEDETEEPIELFTPKNIWIAVVVAFDGEQVVDDYYGPDGNHFTTSVAVGLMKQGWETTCQLYYTIPTTDRASEMSDAWFAFGVTLTPENLTSYEGVGCESVNQATWGENSVYPADPAEIMEHLGTHWNFGFGPLDAEGCAAGAGILEDFGMGENTSLAGGWVDHGGEEGPVCIDYGYTLLLTENDAGVYQFYVEDGYIVRTHNYSEGPVFIYGGAIYPLQLPLE